MRHGTKLATALAVALTVFSGIAAVGATTGLLTSGPDPSAGKVRLVDQATPDAPRGRSTARAGRRGSRTARPRRPAVPIRAGVAAGRTGRGGPGADPRAGSDDNREQRPARRSGARGRRRGRTESATATTTPTTPVVDPGPPALDCHSSDDGMSEAEKQARERACEGEHDDD